MLLEAPQTWLYLIQDTLSPASLNYLPSSFFLGKIMLFGTKGHLSPREKWAGFA